ncbi:oxidoreductase [Haematococcus lacustris]|uniref:Oxidoreductase n=1 Tax=Haematococcus lacustris TaxID=44745 RepID=A0A699YB40_HAELA|nr:oxidoreductase [Haematococcus lacustris]
MLGRGDAARNAGGLQSSQSAVFLTGASTGIGYAAAKLLASKGWRVYAGVRRAEDAARLQACSTLITPLIVDVTQHATVEAAVELIGREQGLDIFSWVYPNTTTQWEAVRRDLDAGYEVLGDFQDLDHSGVNYTQVA